MFDVFDNKRELRTIASGCRLLPLAAAVALCVVGSVSAATIKVNDATALSVAGKCTIVDAVISLNTAAVAPGSTCSAGDGNNDTIDLSAFTSATTITFVTPMTTDSALALSAPATISGNLDGFGKPLVMIERTTQGNPANFRLIDTTANLTLRGVVLSNGHAAINGGAIQATRAGAIAHPALTLIDTAVSASQADGGGGGISGNGAITLNSSTVSGNTSTGNGGGINGAGTGLVTAKDSTISGNSSQTNGGGVYAQNIALDFCSITNNTAPLNAAAGVAIGTAVSSPTVTATATLIFGNNSGNDIDSTNLQTLGGDHNLIGIYSHNITLATPSVDCTNGLMLDVLVDNGGPTKTHALLAGSCAIDAGPTFPPGTIPSDQRGNAYARRVGAATDIGAYEAQKGDRIFYDGFGL